jgi:Subtilase family
LRPGLKGALPILAVGVAQLAILFVAWLQDPEPTTPAERRAERADVGGPFPLELRSPQVVAGTSARVLVALRRPSLAELEAKTPQSPARERAYVRSLHREARALMSALDAKGVRFGDPILFARVWSGFAATIATKDLPAVQTLGLRVEPVARFYPAQVPSDDAPEVRPLPTKARGEVAVLDAFPRRGSGRLSMDAVGRSGSGRISAAERAGERITAVVKGELPNARVARVRVAGSQALENGKFQVFGTTDQLLAGLERAVDPDEDGDSSDAPPVAVTGLGAPYSGFDGSAIAEAVDAAAQLGTLVVAPAGNGGDPDGPFGAITAPGAAQRALTVGALDSDGDVAQGSSRGPTYALGPKPDLAIGGGASTGAGKAWGTAIAGARVAGVAAALRAERRLSVDETAAALIGTAAPRGDADGAGGGDPLLQAARAVPFVAQPAQIAIRRGATTTIRLTSLRRGLPAIQPKRVDGLTLTAAGSRLRVTATKDASGAGRIEVGPIAIPYQVIEDAPPAPPLGRPQVIVRGGKPDGVRFVAGSIDRGDKGTSVIPVGNLVLTLTGPTKRELTPPGGARDLLPGEYAYTLTDEIKSQLEPGRYRFELRARGTAGGEVVSKRSRSFKVS